jgi:dienelactone hydrolase
MDVITQTDEKGVVERRFDLTVSGDTVPGIVWLPSGSSDPLPTVLIGHGGTSHKRAPYVLALARGLARHLGYAAVAIDAPGHGERVTDPTAADAARRELEQRMRSGSGEPMRMTPERAREWIERTTRGVGDWQATLTDLQASGISNDQIGYWGVSMGTIIGLPFVSDEPRVRAAVFGLCGVTGDRFAASARALTVPIMFLLQWNDELVTHESGLALWEAFGSAAKTMHINPGRHVEIPRREMLAAEVFFRTHLV